MARSILAAHPHDTRWLSALASLTIGALFFALWFWLLPPLLGFQIDNGGPAPLLFLRRLAAIPAICGFAVALRCVWDFGWTGHGTPAPILPPHELVTTGFYRYVRNPMYIGFFTGWIGLWIVFGHATWTAVSLAALAIACVMLFVLSYEEPTLREKFGLDYEDYCRHVPRWIPRLHPWEP